ncbi:MAG: UbiA family prenyltransferase [Pirellulales bacterium]
MARLVYLIQVSRPIIWPFLPLVYVLGLHAAKAEVSAIAAVQIVLLTFPMNTIGCGLNDIFDYESDRLCRRRPKVWGTVVSDQERPLVWRAALVMTPLVLVGGLATGNAWNIAATIGLLAVAWAYSVPPVRLKERPPLDSLANGLGYFLLPLAMGYSLGADPRTMPLRYYLLALCVCGVHALAAAADYEVDRAAGHRTIAVVYGRRAAAAGAFAAFLATWLAGDFVSGIVRAYLLICAGATLVAMLAPRERPIAIACIIIFVGFLAAAPLYVAGW